MGVFKPALLSVPSICRRIAKGLLVPVEWSSLMGNFDWAMERDFVRASGSAFSSSAILILLDFGLSKAYIAFNTAKKQLDLGNFSD